MKKWLLLFLLIPSLAWSAEPNYDTLLTEQKVIRGDLMVKQKNLEGQIEGAKGGLKEIEIEIAEAEGKMKLLMELKSEKEKKKNDKTVK